MLDNSNPTQCERILDYMEVHGSITQLEALQELGVMRLTSRIANIKKYGYPIVSEMVTVENRFNEKCRVKRYMLAKDRGGYDG